MKCPKCNRKILELDLSNHSRIMSYDCECGAWFHLGLWYKERPVYNNDGTIEYKIIGYENGYIDFKKEG